MSKTRKLLISKHFLVYLLVFIITFSGFNTKNKVQLNNDIFVSLDTILNSLDIYGFEMNKSESLEYLMQSAL